MSPLSFRHQYHLLAQANGGWRRLLAGKRLEIFWRNCCCRRRSSSCGCSCYGDDFALDRFFFLRLGFGILAFDGSRCCICCNGFSLGINYKTLCRRYGRSIERLGKFFRDEKITGRFSIRDHAGWRQYAGNRLLNIQLSCDA